MQALAAPASPERSPYEDLGGFYPAPEGTPTMHDALVKAQKAIQNTNYDGSGDTLHVVTGPQAVRAYLHATRDPLSAGQRLEADHQARVAVQEMIDQDYRDAAQRALNTYQDGHRTNAA